MNITRVLLCEIDLGYSVGAQTYGHVMLWYNQHITFLHENHIKKYIILNLKL